jgi:hypothetical protein
MEVNDEVNVRNQDPNTTLNHRLFQKLKRIKRSKFNQLINTLININPE